jgi:hypothetical protein
MNFTSNLTMTSFKLSNSLDSLIDRSHQQATNKLTGLRDKNSYGSSEHIMASITECHFKELKRRQRKFRGRRLKHGRGSTRGKVHTTGQQMNQFKKFNKGRISKQKKTDFSGHLTKRDRWSAAKLSRPSARPPYSDEEIIPFPEATSLEEQKWSHPQRVSVPPGAMMQVWRQPEKGHHSGTGDTSARELCWQGCRPP